MFWRLGSVELSRPVAAPVWLKLVWIRPVLAVDRRGQRVHVGALELLQLAVLQDQAGQLVPHRGELLQHVGVGGGAGLGLLEDRELLLLEQDRRELPRRVDVEVHARHLRDLDLQPPEVGAQLLAQPGEERAVDADPLPLHVHQHLDQRHLDVAEQVLHLDLAQRRREEVVQGEHGGAVGAAVVGGREHGDLGEGDLRLSLPHHVLVGLHRAAEVLEAEVVDRVGAAAGIEHEAREHRVVGDAGQLDPGAAQHLPVVLDVVAGLGDRGIGEQRARAAPSRGR